MNLRTLSTDEFMRYAYAQMDPITATDLELELFKRFEDYLSNFGGLCELVEELGGQDHCELFKLLATNDLANVTELTRAIRLLKVVHEYAQTEEELSKMAKVCKKLKELNNDSDAIADIADFLNEAKDIY